MTESNCSDADNRHLDTTSDLQVKTEHSSFTERSTTSEHLKNSTDEHQVTTGVTELLLMISTQMMVSLDL